MIAGYIPTIFVTHLTHDEALVLLCIVFLGLFLFAVIQLIKGK